MFVEIMSIILAILLIGALVVIGVWGYKAYRQKQLVTTMQETITNQELVAVRNKANMMKSYEEMMANKDNIVGKMQSKITSQEQVIAARTKDKRVFMSYDTGVADKDQNMRNIVTALRSLSALSQKHSCDLIKQHITDVKNTVMAFFTMGAPPSCSTMMTIIDQYVTDEETYTAIDLKDAERMQIQSDLKLINHSLFSLCCDGDVIDPVKVNHMVDLIVATFCNT